MEWSVVSGTSLSTPWPRPGHCGGERKTGVGGQDGREARGGGGQDGKEAR